MKRRLIYAAAAVLAMTALALPLWGFAMSAPQYPDETLHLQVVRTGIVGDVHEVSTLQQYIGVRFPTNLPELQWATRAIVGLAALLLLAAFAGNGRFGRVYRVLCAVALVGFLAASAVTVQARLYQVGHDRNPNAPIRAVHDFTPPLVGPVKVGNFTVWSFPDVGAVLLLCAAALSVYGVRLKPHTPGEGDVQLKKPATITDGDIRLKPNPAVHRDVCSDSVPLQPDRPQKAMA